MNFNNKIDTRRANNENFAETEEESRVADADIVDNFNSTYYYYPKDTLNLNIRDTEVTRFYCRCHKLNVAVRHAFELH